MRQLGLVGAGLTFLYLQGLSATAQSSIDILDQDLKEAQQEHQVATTQSLATFLSQLDAAASSPEAAMALYQNAGGKMPETAPVETKYEHETPSEREAREAQDKAKLSSLGLVVELHCGLMRYGASFVVHPDEAGLHDAWIAWLKSAAQLYPQIKSDDDLQPPPPSQPSSKASAGKPQAAPPARKETVIMDFKKATVRDSGISNYLGFHGWADKEQGAWNVKGIPDLYRKEVLDPLRVTPSADTLAAWDVYIAMKNVDQPDNDKWTQNDYPSLAFDRACDDYAITPSMDKLMAVVSIIKANPVHPKLDEMIAHAHQLVSDYRGRHGGTVPVAQGAATPSAPPTDPNVVVTKTVEGDMTIITTHTNTPPANPVPSTPAQ